MNKRIIVTCAMLMALAQTYMLSARYQQPGQGGEARFLRAGDLQQPQFKQRLKQHHKSLQTRIEKMLAKIQQMLTQMHGKTNTPKYRKHYGKYQFWKAAKEWHKLSDQRIHATQASQIRDLETKLRRVHMKLNKYRKYVHFLKGKNQHMRQGMQQRNQGRQGYGNRGRQGYGHQGQNY